MAMTVSKYIERAPTGYTGIRRRQQHGIWMPGIILFVLLMARACAVGIQYWPQLDDYIQHHNYAAKFTFSQLQEVVGVLSSRPLAGLADYFVWTPLFGQMIVGAAIISALYVVATLLLKAVLERYVPVGPLFPVVMVLLPLGVEGTYWMSASTRVVCGLFFAALAAWTFGKWLDSGNWWWAVGFCVLMPLPFGFYEQSAVLAMTLALGMGLLELGNHWKRSVLALWSLPAAALYFMVIGMLSTGGVYASRTEFMLPWYPGYWSSFFPSILWQMKTVFLDANVFILTKGLARGAGLIFTEGRFLWLIGVTLLCVLFGWLWIQTQGTKKEDTNLPLALLMGVLLTLAPLTLFLILDNPWFSLRGAVTSFPGLALLCDSLVLALWNGRRFQQIGPTVVACMAAIWFSIAGMSEMADYRDTYRNDQKAADAVLARLPEDFPTPESREGVRVGILGVEPTFLADQNFYYHEHGAGCTESSWAMMGLLTCRGGEGAVPTVTPLPTASGEVYRKWNAETSRPESFDALYWYDGEKVERLTLEQAGEHDFRLYIKDQLLGRLWEDENSVGYLELQ